MTTSNEQKVTKVLFLDVDGILNSEETFKRKPDDVIGLDVFMCFLLVKILEATGARVVLSSSWRGYKEGVEEIKNKFLKFVEEHDFLNNSTYKEYMKDFGRGCSIQNIFYK